MKTASPKTTDTRRLSSATTQEDPFFSRNGEGLRLEPQRGTGVFAGDEPFFSPAFIQPKLTIGQPDDPYEKEADAKAEQVVEQLHAPAYSAPAIQAKCEDCAEEEQVQEKEERERVRRKPVFGAGDDPPDDLQPKSTGNLTAEATPDLQRQLNHSSGGGHPLPDTTRSGMEAAFRTDFSDVRVHTGPGATGMNQNLGAQAFTHGSDIYFNKGKYNPQTKGGQKLLAHELTHVTQQRGKIRRRIQRFEAAHHEHVERGALGGAGGFSDAELDAVYFGNWSRDFSQIFTNNPLTNALGNELMFEVMNIMAIHKFGRQLNPRDFGIYSPREHIDNPTGQINPDLMRGEERKFRQFGPDQQVRNPEEDISSPEAVRQLFVVNEAGLPAYLGRSIQYVEEEFSQAADLGRTQDGLMHFGNGLHTVEDLFAHSNYVEICIGKLYQDGRLPMSDNLRTELEGRTEGADGGIMDPVETFGARTEGGRPILLTGTFTTTDTFVSILEALIAFLNEFEPFGPSNDARSQQNTEMILGRVDELRQTGQAGTIIRSFMTSMGRTISDQLGTAVRDAIAGRDNEPQQPQSLWDRAVSTVREGVGSLVGAGVSALGSVMQWGWVQDLFAGGANAFSQISFVEIYRFILKLQNRIDQFLDNVKDRIKNALRRLPAPIYNFLAGVYRRIKNFIETQVDRVRELLKTVIQAVFRMVAGLLQKLLVRWLVSRTNIQGQIERDFTTIEENVANNARNPREAERFRRASREEKLRMLYDPRWRELAEMSEEDVERLRQMNQSPEYIRQGPSHSQIAKDHSDSPFFGTAAVLAGHAVRNLRDKMTAIWSDEGRNTQTLTENYQSEISPGIASRRAPAGTASGNMTPEQRQAEDEAVETAPHYPELRSREEGEYLLREGHLDEDHDHGEASLQVLTRQLRRLLGVIYRVPGQLRSIANRLEHLAPDIAAQLRELAEIIPEDLEGLVEEIESATSDEHIRRLIARLDRVIEKKNIQFDVAKRVLRRAAARVAALDPTLDELAEQIRTLADRLDDLLLLLRTLLRRVSDYLAELTDFERATRRQFEAIRNMDPVATGAWDPSLEESHFGPARPGAPLSDARREMRDYLREEIFAHPYDTHWWEAPLIQWCRANQERLETYIRARNEGRVHDH